MDREEIVDGLRQSPKADVCVLGGCRTSRTFFGNAFRTSLACGPTVKNTACR